jgi:primosomal protein N' (replication factor Y)
LLNGRVAAVQPGSKSQKQAYKKNSKTRLVNKPSPLVAADVRRQSPFPSNKPPIHPSTNPLSPAPKAAEGLINSQSPSPDQSSIKVIQGDSSQNKANQGLPKNHQSSLDIKASAAEMGDTALPRIGAFNPARSSYNHGKMIARVTLEIALRKEFDYSIPAEFAPQIEIGSRVKVPFGPREVLGVVTSLIEESTHTNLRPILKVIGRQSLVTPKVLQLARWISDYYCCPVETALKSVLPDSVRKEEEGWRERLYVRIAPRTGELPKLTKRQEEVWNIIEEWRELPLQELLRLTDTTAETVRKLEDKGLVIIAPQISERDPYANEHILPSQPLELNPEQVVAYKKIVEAMDTVIVPDPAQAKAPPVVDAMPIPKPPANILQLDFLSGTQKAAADPKLPETNSTSPKNGNPSRVFLLHGVTGSGKTEVYLQAIAHALEQGKGAIVLVPEISLTPQTVERFKARFSSGKLQTLVAVIHSHLSAGERHDEWHKIRQGRARIVIGARSAIFAPIEPLGLVIVDEEHEHSYKQEEAPRYHARDVAVVRGQMEGAVVVLGTATPSMETFYNVQKGKYTLLEMPTRCDDKKMPIVRVVDMRQESRKQKGPPIFSNQLKEAIHQRLERKEQTILFLNRRGYSTSLQCPLCGYVAECPNCSVSLTYHRTTQKLCCHVCAHEVTAPRVCPDAKCANPAIRYSGLGTQKVEETLEKLFPHARIKRMDSDALKKKDDYRRILGDFRIGKIDILVGTQMIAKGLHFPNVTLVGIIHADLSLHIPDFRAGERTFQLLTQVSGRAGRGDVEGEVIIQAFTPFHPAIQYARRHDFIGFYEQEIEFRDQLKYPPASRVCMLTVRGRNEEKVKFSIDHIRRELDTYAPEIKDLVIAGPAPAPLARAESNYRYQVMLRTRQMPRLSRILAKLTEALELPEDTYLAVDIDPVNLS